MSDTRKYHGLCDCTMEISNAHKMLEDLKGRDHVEDNTQIEG
jgi:hypothetical protein